MERRHELVLGVERHLGPAGQRVAGLLGVDAHLRGEHDEGRLGGIPDDRPVVADGRRSQSQAQGEAAEVGRVAAGHTQDRAGLPVPGALDRYQSPPASIVVAVIAFIVSVPVLSLLMTVVPPRVSTS